MKKSFVLYCDQYKPLKDFTDNQKAQLLDAIFCYNCENEVVNISDPTVKAVFGFFESAFERDQEKYEKICERNRNNGLKGGRPSKPKKPSGLSGNPKNPSEPRKADTDTGNDSGKDIICRIVNYLNEKTGTKFRPTTKKTVNLIKARFNEGFTSKDFKIVIDFKTKEWSKNPDMMNYLRPETLFGTKFESYLNARQEPKKTIVVHHDLPTE